MLVAAQVCTPTSYDVILYTVNLFSVVVMFNDLDTIMYLLLLSDTFIISLVVSVLGICQSSLLSLTALVCYAYWLCLPCHAGIAKCILYSYRSYNRTRLSVSYKPATYVVSYAYLVSHTYLVSYTLYLPRLL